MRIAIFTDTFLPQINGVTNTLRRLGDWLEASDHDYIFITPDQKQEGDMPYNIEKFFSAPFLLYPECRLSVPNIFRMTKRLDCFKPDILFLMTEFSMGLAGLRYGQKNGIPVVSNYSTNFNTIVKAYKLGIFEKTLDKYIGWFHNEADLTVTPSQASKEVLTKLGVYRTAIFGRGIDAHKFSPSHRSEALRKTLGIEYKIALLYVGRISLEKDIDILRDTMHRLNETHKDKISLVMVGEGPMKGEMEKTMPDNVIFTGYKKGTALSEIYASCDLFAFPSSFETFGNVVLEAYASGLPVVGVNKGGVTASIDHDRSGYLAEARDVASFTHYLKRCIDNNMLRHQFAQRGKAYARTRTWAAVFTEFTDKLATIIEAKNTRPLKNCL